MATLALPSFDLPEANFDIETASAPQLGAGDAYSEAIQPRFDILKARRFDSSWNWVHQDALLMYYDINFWLAHHCRSRNYRPLHCPP